jgi:hypothetical protein
MTFMTCIFTRYYQGNINMDRTCRTHRRNLKYKQNFSRKLGSTKLLAKPNLGSEDNIRMDLKETGWFKIVTSVGFI